MRRILRWYVAEPPALKHPYRDTLLVYAGLAVVIVLFAVFTGGKIGKATILAVAFFFLASVWGLVRRHQMLRREAQKRELGDP